MGNKELEVLEKFIFDEDLKKLEKKFNKFNIFDCLRLTRTEICHSNFLAWLLDPNETHGLNDYFLKEFLKEILINNKGKIEKINCKNLILKKYNTDETVVEKYTIPSLFDIDYWDMQNAEILREHENIDLLIIDETNKFVFVIENKVDTCQHDNQLTKYRTYVDEQYSDSAYKKLYIYLKPKKEDVEEPYIYIGYDLIQKILEKIIDDNQINSEVLTSIKHYKYILERDFMQKDEISEICRKIYKKHKTAIDLINKYSDTRSEMFEILKEVLEEENELNISHIGNNSIICLPSGVENPEKLHFAKWEPDDLIIHLHFMNCIHGHKDMCFELLIGPAKNTELKSKRQNLADYLKTKMEIKLNGENTDWVHTPAICLLSIDEFYECENLEKAKELIKTRLQKKKSLYIDSLRNALNSWNV